MYNFVTKCQQSEATLENILNAEEEKDTSEDHEKSETDVNTSKLITNNTCLKNKGQSLDECDEALCSENEPEILILVETDSEKVTEVTDKNGKNSELETLKTMNQKF